MNWPVYIRTDMKIQKGNSRMDQVVKLAPEESNFICVMPLILRADLPSNPIYEGKHKELIAKCQAKQQNDGWQLTENEHIVLPEILCQM